MRWKHLAIVIAAGLAALAFFGYLSVFGPDEVVYRGKIREGNAVVAQIEAFRSQHQRLPASLEEAGLPPSDPERLHYERCDDNKYVVWLGTTLGESMTYDSLTGSWQSLNIACENPQ